MTNRENSKVTCGAICPYMRQRACTLPNNHKGGEHTDGERLWEGPSMDPPRQVPIESVKRAEKKTCRPKYKHAKPCGPVPGRDDACACGCEADDVFCTTQK
jgi:hypothetical protein